jgi:hypothetical protein
LGYTGRSISTHLTASGGRLTPIYASHMGSQIPVATHVVLCREAGTCTASLYTWSSSEVMSLHGLVRVNPFSSKRKAMRGAGSAPPRLRLRTSPSLLLRCVAAKIREIYQLLEVGKITYGQPKSACTRWSLTALGDSVVCVSRDASASEEGQNMVPLRGFKCHHPCVASLTHPLL